MVQRVDHIDLKVPDMKAALSFFGSLGFTVPTGEVGPGPVAVSLPGDLVTLDIREDASVTTTTLHHVALRTADQTGDLIAIRNAGLTVSKVEALNPASGRTISNFADPFGKSWQLTN